MRALIKRIFMRLLDLIDLIRELKKGYSERKKFKDYVKQDVGSDSLWLDTNAFAKLHDIDGHKILGVFTTDTKGQTVNLRNESELDGIGEAHGVFYCSVDAVSGFNTNQPLKLDGKLYTVREAQLVQEYMWRVVLESNEDLG